MKGRTAALLVLAIAAPAEAGSIWSNGAADDASLEKAASYEKWMSDGDDAATLAASGSESGARAKKRVLQAANDYEQAAEIRPDLAEPHWRAANVLFGFFYDCDVQSQWAVGGTCLNDSSQNTVDPKIGRRILKHWDAIEQIDPRDPRLWPGDFGAGILFERAIVRTKLGTDDDLAQSIVDYNEWLDRSQASDPSRGLVLGNLAEGYMMVGDLENSIATYNQALALRSDTSLLYGLAVAYDRDGQSAKAHEIISALGKSQFTAWDLDVTQGVTFYVPEGEAFYYYGVAYASFGETQDAIDAYKKFVRSGAHPQYDARALELVQSLQKKLKKP